ncbi:hypothetical protein IPL85_05670 [Candidatus Saccharibacteria bacterium]|nr:MAG: hypothetical protein IPL85_05670 [Candidatus Saccharibacteria bacterium]
MPSPMESYPKLDELARQPSFGQVIWSDVFPELVRQNGNGQLEKMWWRYTDTDAVISSRLGNGGNVGMLEVPIGYVPWESIGLLQLDDRAAKRKLPGSIIAIANRAPRGNKQTKDGANGECYRVATTASGLIVFASHLGALADLAMEGRITSLYEIPGKNSIYDEHEQFRSAVVAQMLGHTDELQLVYDRRSKNNDGAPIEQEAQDSIAYVDKFGNIIGRAADIANVIRLEIGKMATLQIEQNGIQYEIPVRRGVDLRSAPEGEIMVYPNMSDGGSQKKRGPGIYEIIARVNDEPSVSLKTAIFLLQKHMGGTEIDPFKCSVRLFA